jgi:hypothetical protein
LVDLVYCAHLHFLEPLFQLVGVFDDDLDFGDAFGGWAVLGWGGTFMVEGLKRTGMCGERRLEVLIGDNRGFGFGLPDEQDLAVFP